MDHLLVEPLTLRHCMGSTTVGLPGIEGFMRGIITFLSEQKLTRSLLFNYSFFILYFYVHI